jgi:signal transduction histidine kinase
VIKSWRKRSRLGLRLVVASILVSFFLSIFSTTVQLTTSYLRQRDQALESFNQIEAGMIDSLQQALWTFDFDQVELIIDGIVAISSLSYLSLETSSGHNWQLGETSKQASTRSYDLMMAGQSGQKTPLGMLTVELSLDSVVASLWAQFWTILGSNFLKAYLAAFALLIIFQQMVTRHLHRIADYIDGSQPLVSGQPLRLDRHRELHPDELDKIAEAVAHYETRVSEAVQSLQAEVEDRRKAEEETRQALSIRNAFLANMSHEVRTPLNSMLGLLHLIENGEGVQEKYKSYATVGSRAGHQLLDQINNTLEIARLDSQAVTNQPRPTYLADLAEQWQQIGQANVAIQGKEIEITVDLPPDRLPPVHIDGPKVTQIVSNLLSNAVKFTPSGEINIAITPPQEGQLTITVSDSGPGIPPRDRQRIFDRFVQLDDGIKRGHRGSGLGLAICTELAQAINATLQVEDPKDTRFATSFVLKVYL